MNGGPDQKKSFQELKEAIANAVTLRYPDPNAPFKLYTDASEVGIGAVLTQEGDEDGERPVCFLSRRLQASEHNYATVEKELLAEVYALKKLRKYQFDLYTDNAAVRYLFQKAEPNQRLQRWILAIQEFRLKVHHLPEKQNVVADVLSRYPPARMTATDEEDVLEGMYSAWLMEDSPLECWLMDIWKYVKSPQDHDWVTDDLRKRAAKYRLDECGILFQGATN